MTGAQFARFFRGEYATLMCCRSGARKLAVRSRGLRSNGIKGVELSQCWSRTTQELSFSHQRGYRGGAQSPNQSNLRTCVPSRKIFPMSGLRSKSLLNRFSVPLLPKPQLKKRNFMHVRHSPLGRETEGDFYLGRQSRPVIHKGP